MKNYLTITILFVLPQMIGGQCNVRPDLAGENIPGSKEVCTDPISVYEDSTRIPLRKFVFDQMADLDEKTVVDIGAGPGFFAFEMAKKAKRVIATELDDLFLRYMTQKCQEGNIYNFEVRKANDKHSELYGLRADYALMVYVFHYLRDPKSFLTRLKSALVPGGKLFVVNAQLSPVIIKDYLVGAGFTDLSEISFTYKTQNCGPQEVQMIIGCVP